MPIRFFRPRAELAGVVSRIYAHDIGPSPQTGQPWLIAPDGDIKLIFPTRGDIRCTIGDSIRLHAAARLIVAGMRTLPGSLHFPDGVEAIGVIVRAEAASRLLRVPLHELANRTVDGEELFGAIAGEWSDRLVQSSSVEARVECVQAILLEAMHPRRRHEPAIEHAVRQLRSSTGMLPIEPLARELGWSRRQLERQFLEQIGVSPKNLASVFRFHAAYRRLRLASNRRYGSIVFDHYYDQSHFLRDFKRFTGLTPSIYAATPDYGRFYIPG